MGQGTEGVAATVASLVRRRYVERRRQGGHVWYAITEKGEEAAVALGVVVTDE